MTENHNHNNIFMPEDHMEKLYNSGNFLVRLVHNNRLNAIVDNLPKKKLNVLDAGCGEGHLIKKIHSQFPENLYYGADITDIALLRAKERCPFAQFQKMDLSNLNYPDNFFDAVICTEVLEHIRHYERVISELIRILKKEGTLIITFPNEPLWTLSRFILGRRPIKVPDHVNSFTPRLITSKIPLKTNYHTSIPFPLPFFISLGYLIKFEK